MVTMVGRSLCQRDRDSLQEDIRGFEVGLALSSDIGSFEDVVYIQNCKPH